MSVGDINIRSAVEADCVSVLHLTRVLGYEVNACDLKRRLARILTDESQRLFVAVTVKGEVAAWAHVFVAARLGLRAFAEVGGIVVAKHLRRRGIGAMLITACEQWAMENNRRMLRVRSNTTRRDAYGFYADLGFEHTKEQVVFDKFLGSGGDRGSHMGHSTETTK